MRQVNPETTFRQFLNSVKPYIVSLHNMEIHHYKQAMQKVKRQIDNNPHNKYNNAIRQQAKLERKIPRKMLALTLAIVNNQSLNSIYAGRIGQTNGELIYFFYTIYSTFRTWFSSLFCALTITEQKGFMKFLNTDKFFKLFVQMYFIFPFFTPVQIMTLIYYTISVPHINKLIPLYPIEMYLSDDKQNNIGYTFKDVLPHSIKYLNNIYHALREWGNVFIFRDNIQYVQSLIQELNKIYES